MKTILITGAGGYIGSVMVEMLLAKGYNVKGLDRFFFGENLLSKEILNNPRFQLVKNDIRWVAPDVFKGVDAVIDLAALSNDPSGDFDPKLTQEINNLGRVRIARLAKESGVARYILASSCSVYGHGLEEVLSEDSPLNPLTEYAKANAAAEKAVIPLHDHSFSTTALRQATVYGLSYRMRFDLVVNMMTLHAVQRGKIFIMGGGKQWRPLVHVRDTANAFILVMESPKDLVNGQVFNIGSSQQNYQILNLAHIVKENLPIIVDLEIAPDDQDKRNYQVSFEKIKHILGFKPHYTPDMGVKEIYNALKTGKTETDEKTVTVKWYKYLFDADEILRKVKIDGRLF